MSKQVIIGCDRPGCSNNGAPYGYWLKVSLGDPCENPFCQEDREAFGDFGLSSEGLLFCCPECLIEYLVMGMPDKVHRNTYRRLGRLGFWGGNRNA